MTLNNILKTWSIPLNSILNRKRNKIPINKNIYHYLIMYEQKSMYIIHGDLSVSLLHVVHVKKGGDEKVILL